MIVALHELVDWCVVHWVRATLTGLLSLLICAAVAEQFNFRIKRKNLPGPSWTWPFIGGIVDMVLHPYEFWHRQFDLGRISWNSIVGQFVVTVSDASLCRTIFQNTSAKMPLILHPSAYKLLGKNNIAFMNGPEHKELRSRLLPLFTPRALSVYLHLQEKAIRVHLSKWFALSASAGEAGMTMKPLVWNLNCETSMTVFLGTYLMERREEIQMYYKQLTDGFLAFPLDLPGTTMHKGIKAKHALVPLLQQIVAQSKDAMRAGQEPACLLDFWMANTVKEIDEAKANGLPMPPHSDDYEVACVTLDFLFASQDASTASLVWCIETMCRHPDVLEKMRAEQRALRPNEEPITLDLMAQMNYTRQVMLEILRQYPPATMVPHVAYDDNIKIGEYKVPRGALIMPSIYASTHQGYPEPNKFDPDRFGPERQEDRQFNASNFLVFGAGPHMCLGAQYAKNHIMCFLSLVCMEADIVRKWTDKSNTCIYAPTIYPADECVLAKITPRA